jgi:hypothetical protein
VSLTVTAVMLNDICWNVLICNNIWCTYVQAYIIPKGVQQEDTPLQITWLLSLILRLVLHRMGPIFLKYFLSFLNQNVVDTTTESSPHKRTNYGHVCNYDHILLKENHKILSFCVYFLEFYCYIYNIPKEDLILWKCPIIGVTNNSSLI